MERVNSDVNEVSLGTASVRPLVKSLGVLLGFCDLEDWDSVKLGFNSLLKFSIDKRPKVSFYLPLPIYLLHGFPKGIVYNWCGNFCFVVCIFCHVHMVLQYIFSKVRGGLIR